MSNSFQDLSLNNPAYATLRRRRLLAGLGVLAALLLFAALTSVFNSSVADYLSEDAVIGRVDLTAIEAAAKAHVGPTEPVHKDVGQGAVLPPRP